MLLSDIRNLFTQTTRKKDHDKASTQTSKLKSFSAWTEPPGLSEADRSASSPAIISLNQPGKYLVFLHKLHNFRNNITPKTLRHDVHSLLQCLLHSCSPRVAAFTLSLVSHPHLPRKGSRPDPSHRYVPCHQTLSLLQLHTWAHLRRFAKLKKINSGTLIHWHFI